MLHLRVIAPSSLTDAVLALLKDEPAAVNLTLDRGGAIQPSGDVVTCDLAREGVNAVVEHLRELGVHREGSIALDHIDVSVSDAAAEAERRAPGHGSDAAVWEDVDARVRDESVLTASFLLFMVLAALIAVVGLVEDAPILIVGAMVVGPEFGPLSGLAVGIFKLRWTRIRMAVSTLTIGLAVAALGAALGTLALSAIDLVPPRFEPHAQPLTGFIVEPSILSFVVAFLAGAAGTLSLTQAKAGALIGVLISVTTIPAVAAFGVSAALGQWHDAGGAATQLGLNLAALVLAGVLTLWVQREAWERVAGPVRRAIREND